MTNDLIPVPDNSYLTAIGNELTRLFELQGSALSELRRSLLVQEIARRHFPIEAITRGLRKLVSEKGRISFGMMMEAIDEEALKPLRDLASTNRCGNCGNTGFISMREDATSMVFALGCNCALGRRKKETPWNGEAEQMANGRLLKKL